MAETKAKKPATRRPRTKKAANSPAPSMETTPTRTVRYCGPTSSPSHHHAAVAAKHAEHTWVASIVAGLAIVVTATLAFNAVQASSEQDQMIRSTELRGDISREIHELNVRLTELESKIDRISANVSQ